MIKREQQETDQAIDSGRFAFNGLLDVARSRQLFPARSGDHLLLLSLFQVSLAC